MVAQSCACAGSDGFSARWTASDTEFFDSLAGADILPSWRNDSPEYLEASAVDPQTKGT